MTISDLELEAYDTKRKQWCYVVGYDSDEKILRVTDGEERFDLDSDKTEVQINGSNLMASKGIV